MGIVCAGVAWVLFNRRGWDVTGIAIEVVGWALLIAIIVMRTRYHRRRMRGDYQV